MNYDELILVLPFTVMGASILFALIILYVWACIVLGKFAKSRGHSFAWWVFWSLVITPFFAPSLYFYVFRKKTILGYFHAVYAGVGFTFFYIPFAMFSFLLTRMLALKNWFVLRLLLRHQFARLGLMTWVKAGCSHQQVVRQVSQLLTGQLVRELGCDRHDLFVVNYTQYF